MPIPTRISARRAELTLINLHDHVRFLHNPLMKGAATLEKRIDIPCCNDSSPSGLVEAETIDPWRKSGKYALGWVSYALILLFFTAAIHWYHYWNDRILVASHKEKFEDVAQVVSSERDDGTSVLSADRSTRNLFPPRAPVSQLKTADQAPRSNWLMRNVIALSRLALYRPIPNFRIHKQLNPVAFPSPASFLIMLSALAFTLLYCFVPQPLVWQSIQYGAPPLAVRAGMIAVALMPWIVALSMKANFVTVLTGIGHERLNVFHRWLAYICLVLSIIHTVPFYITPIRDNDGLALYQSLLRQQSGTYIYGTGIAALVPICVLCVHSYGPLRRKFYEAFVLLHVPMAILFLAMLFWHCNNYLTSWNYLFATVAIWLGAYIFRLFYLNWTNPWRMSFCVGEEAAITVLHDNAVKVTIPTQKRWKPGQYVYLRMPGVSLFENHPFTIASLCSDDYPSQYDENYRDLVVVFKPYGGFTKKVLDSALDHGPWWTYRAFIDGPYGGMRRGMDSFEHIVLIAGGTGITAVVSNLLDVIKRMRDGKAVTKSVQLIWAMKRPETMEWFKEELRICREFAPPETVSCHFYITAAKRLTQSGAFVSAQTPGRPLSMALHDKVNNVFQNNASNRYSAGSWRNSALIREEADGDPEKEMELRKENEDHLKPLPQAHLRPAGSRGEHLAVPPGTQTHTLDHSPSWDARTTPGATIEPTPHLPPHPTLLEKRRSRPMHLDIAAAQAVQQQQHTTEAPHLAAGRGVRGEGPGAGAGVGGFDFGFPSTPTEFQKNLMRFAFMPAAVKSRRSGWNVEWGRPDIPYTLRELSGGWSGRKACVFVCGPPSMRMDVSRTVADLQRLVLRNERLDEIYLHTENYAL